MIELTLSTVVKDSDLKMACAVLGGLCAMEPWRDLHHVQFYRGPTQARGLPKLSSVVDLKNPARKETASLWRELNQNLIRQSSVVRAKYEVFSDRDFAVVVPDRNGLAGTLIWADFPEPPSQARPWITQRKKVEIWDQNNIPLGMADNNYLFKSEAIEEALHFYREDVEFCLFRHYPLPQVHGDRPKPLSVLPPWHTLKSFDSEHRWLFIVKYHVLQDNKPDEIKKGTDVLMNIKKELEGVFDFRIYDRRCHDTRIAKEISNTPVPLPNRQVL